jgi:hypothetical protein
MRDLALHSGSPQIFCAPELGWKLLRQMAQVLTFIGGRGLPFWNAMGGSPLDWGGGGM